MHSSIQLTRLSALRGLPPEDWLHAIKQEQLTISAGALIKLILSSKPISIRILCYYRATLSKSPPLISADETATELVKSITRLTSQQDRVQSLQTITALAEPLIKTKPSPILITKDPQESISQLSTLLSLLQLATTYHHHSVLALVEILLRSLTPYIFSCPPTALQPTSELLSLIHAIPHDVIPPITTHHLPSLLRHLSPRTARSLFLNPAQLPPPSPASFITFLLLTPAQPQSLVLARLLALASTLPSTKLVFHLIATAIELPSSNPHHEFDLDGNHQMPWKALLGGGRLAEFIRAAFDSPFLREREHELLSISDLEALAQKLIAHPQHNTKSTLESPTRHPLNQLSSPSPSHSSLSERSQFTARHNLWFALLSSLCSNQLIVPQDIQKLEASPTTLHPILILGHHSQIELGLQPLIECLGLTTKQSTVSELAFKLKESINTASKNFDLSTCISLTKSIASLESLSTIFIWLQPRSILVPIADILDNWTDLKNHSSNVTNNQTNASAENDSSGSEFEKFASLLGWIQGVVGRFGLTRMLRYHLGRTTGFTISYLTNPSTSYPLSTLPSQHVNTLGSWLEALYGSTGISDDLLLNTDPRIFFTICPSLFKQSFDALRIGLIDLQSFRDGLSYFEQELLVVGSAVGVVGWLLDELSRVGPVSPTSYHTALLEILQAILLSDAITSTSIDLISAKSLGLFRKFDSMFLLSPLITNEELEQQQIESNHDLNRRAQLDLAQIEKKLTTAPVSGLITPTAFLCFDFFGRNRIDYECSPITWESALRMAIRMAVLVDEDEDFHGDRSVGLWSLLPHVLNAIPVAEFIRIVIHGTIDAIKAGEGNGTVDQSKTRLRVHVERGWDAQKYIRFQRAVEIAVEIFTWPFDHHQLHFSPLAKCLFEEDSVELIQKYNENFRLLSQVLIEVFGNWGPRITQNQEHHQSLEEAQIERDIVIGCLDRFEILEKACFNSSSSEKDQAQDENQMEEVTEDHPSQIQPSSSESSKSQNRDSILTGLFRQVCFQSLMFEKILSERRKKRLAAANKRKSINRLESRPNKIVKLVMQDGKEPVDQQPSGKDDEEANTTKQVTEEHKPREKETQKDGGEHGENDGGVSHEPQPTPQDKSLPLPLQGAADVRNDHKNFKDSLASNREWSIMDWILLSLNIEHDGLPYGIPAHPSLDDHLDCKVMGVLDC